MRARTAVLVFGAASAAGAAVIGAGVATLLAERAADRVDRNYQALSRVFFRLARYGAAPDGHRPHLSLVRDPAAAATEGNQQ